MADNKHSSSQQGAVKDPEHDGRLKENREAGVTKGTTEASSARSHDSGAKHASSKSDSSHDGKHAASKSSASHDTKSHDTKSHDSKSHDTKSHDTKSGSSKSEASKSSASDDADMKSREYTDADGNVHHHTKAYQESHKN